MLPPSFDNPIVSCFSERKNTLIQLVHESVADGNQLISWNGEQPFQVCDLLQQILWHKCHRPLPGRRFPLHVNSIRNKVKPVVVPFLAQVSNLEGGKLLWGFLNSKGRRSLSMNFQLRHAKIAKTRNSPRNVNSSKRIARYQKYS